MVEFFNSNAWVWTFWIIVGIIFLFLGVVGLMASVDNFSSHHKDRSSTENDTCAEDARQFDMRVVEEDAQSAMEQHQGLVDSFLNLETTCKSALEEIFRFAAAFQGTSNSTSFIDSVRYDVSQVFAIISAANGMVHDDSVRLYQAIFAGLVPRGCLSIEDCRKQIERCERQPIKLPVTVQLLQTSDGLSGKHLASTAAQTYLQLVVATCDLYPNSLAVTAVKATYFDLLNPLVSASNAGGHAESERLLSCEECRSSSHILGLPIKATPEAIKEAYRDVAKVWHPDRFGADDERICRKAEARMTEINQAYTQLAAHMLEGCPPVHPQ